MLSCFLCLSSSMKLGPGVIKIFEATLGKLISPRRNYELLWILTACRNFVFISCLKHHLGTFALLQAYAFLKYVQEFLSKKEFRALFFFGVVGTAGVVFLAVVLLTYAGKTGLKGLGGLLELDLVNDISVWLFLRAVPGCSEIFSFYIFPIDGVPKK